MEPPQKVRPASSTRSERKEPDPRSRKHDITPDFIENKHRRQPNSHKKTPAGGLHPSFRASSQKKKKRTSMAAFFASALLHYIPIASAEGGREGLDPTAPHNKNQKEKKTTEKVISAHLRGHVLFHKDDPAQDVCRRRAQGLAGDVDALLGQVPVRAVAVERQENRASLGALGGPHHRRQEQRDVLFYTPCSRVQYEETGGEG